MGLGETKHKVYKLAEKLHGHCFMLKVGGDTGERGGYVNGNKLNLISVNEHIRFRVGQTWEKIG